MTSEEGVAAFELASATRGQRRSFSGPCFDYLIPFPVRTALRMPLPAVTSHEQKSDMTGWPHMKKVTLMAGTASSRATTFYVGATHEEAVLADSERSRVKMARGIARSKNLGICGTEGVIG